MKREDASRLAVALAVGVAVAVVIGALVLLVQAPSHDYAANVHKTAPFDHRVAAELDRLDQLAEQFALEHPETLDPVAVTRGCAPYSEAFAQLLLDNHFAVQTVVIRLGHNRPRPDVYPDQVKLGEEPPPHWYVRVILGPGNERNYDWTIRQYHPGAAVPFVWEVGPWR